MLNLENFDADTKENGNPFKSSGKRLAVEGVACCACHKPLGKICRKQIHAQIHTQIHAP